MENWKESTTLFIWIGYLLIIVVLISFFVVYLLRRNIKQAKKQKEELILLEEQHLKDLLNKHNQTQEYERRRIGSDLHDAISNKLNIILLKLRIDEKKEIIEKDLDEAVSAVRRIAYDLNPPMINTFSLEVLIMTQFDRLSPKYEVKKWSKTLHKTIWTTEYKIQIIRIIQELVNNIVKHSKATQINIKLRERNGQLFIVVEDNGVGFSIEEKGMGLKNIEDRLFIVGGSFKIKSIKDKGTRIIIAVQNGI